MLNVAETLYRLIEFVQMSIFVRTGVESFNIYQSTDDITYNLLINVPNQASEEPRFAGRVIFSFNPENLGWNNTTTNFIKIAAVASGVEGVLEGPVKVFPLHYEQAKTVDRNAIFVYDDVNQRWIPASTSMSAFN